MDIKSKIIFDYTLENALDSKTFNIKDYISYTHSQDCYENCYLDFEWVDLYRNQIDELELITRVKVVGIQDEWVVVYLYWDLWHWWEPKRVWVSLQARNEQDWYYNDEVTIVINIEWELHQEDLQDWDFVVNDVY